METGRLAVFMGARQPFEIREFPLPEVEPGAILVKVTTANICGSDLHTWRGDSSPLRKEPPRATSLGHEMCGRVYRLGRDVTTDSLGCPLKEGDLVVYPYFYPCQRCEMCLDGDLASCPNKGPTSVLPVDAPPHFTGAFAEYYYLRRRHFVFKVPEDLPEEVVASVNCAFSQVSFGLHKVNLAFGDTVVIQGAGGLGINAIAAARERGASRVIVIDGIKERLELAWAFGADETIDISEFPSPRERVGRVRELTGGYGAHVAVEVVGIPAVINEGVLMVRPGGRYLIIGSITGDAIEFQPGRVIVGNRSIVGSGLYDPWIIPRVLDMIARTRDRYPYERLAASKFPLDQIDEAFRQAEWAKPEGGATRLTRASLVP